MSYTELHLFIDESGDENNINFVGGIAIFGNADDVQSSIKSILVEVRKKYKQLHYTGIPTTQRKQFADFLRKELTKIDNPAIHGITVRYSSEINPSDNSLDNRYVNLLIAVIEYTLFMSEEVRNNLADDAGRRHFL